MGNSAGSLAARSNLGWKAPLCSAAGASGRSSVARFLALLMLLAFASPTWAQALAAVRLLRAPTLLRGELDGSAAVADALELTGSDEEAVALLRFGLAAQKSGRTDVARTYLERAIAASPQSAEAIEARKFLVMWE